MPPRPAAQPVGRTMIGLPAANVPIPGAMRPSVPTMPSMPPAAPAVPGRSPSQPGIPPIGRAPMPTGPVVPVRPSPTPTSIPSPFAAPARPTPPSFPSPIAPPAAPAPSISPAISPAAVSASVDQKLAAFAAKGPEYEAIAKLSREIIEQVVWEVVPELAEAIIREHVAKRGI
jgi:hypothetical protein